jgi:hypothetical protein
MVRQFMTRFGVAVSVAAVVLSLGAGAVFGGEITGNGKVLKVDDSKWGTGLHARSECAYSGQEDLQYLDEEGNPLAEATKGDPAHAQSWGQIPKDFRDFLASIGAHPGTACNPTSGFEE